MSERYARGRLLGAGTWGGVYEATRKTDGLQVAIKIIGNGTHSLDPRDGQHFTSLREIKYLQDMRGKHIIDLVDVYMSQDSAGQRKKLHLVLEFCPYDLEKVIKDKAILLDAKCVKAYMQMLLSAIEHCHANFVLHRDLKPANILFNKFGVLKLADFGLARSFASPVEMTAKVVTLWYRAPELLFGAQFYSGAVDMWAVGCIFAEIILRTPLFAASSENEIEQLSKIFKVMGTPREETWPGVTTLPAYVEFEACGPMGLQEIFCGGEADAASRQALRALLPMITLDPNQRCTAAQALQSQYLSSQPLPCSVGELPVPTSR